MGHLHRNSAFVAWCLLGGAAATAIAAQPGPAATTPVELKIQARSLEEGLNEFARQTGLQVIFRSEEAQGLKAPAVIGTFAPQAALERLLADSGLTYRFVNARTVTVSSKQETTERRPERSSHDLRLVQTQQTPNTPSRTTAATVQQSNEGDETARTAAIPEILVKGNRTLNMDIPRTRDEALPYVIFDRETIDRSGAANLEEFLKNRLTMNTQGRINAQAADGRFGNESQVNLRGLGANQTLILVDGHRIASTAFQNNPQQADINGIPLAAIERIEVLPTSASGIYGGGATGGAINIVLRRDYAGLETKLTYDNTFDSDSAVRRVDISGGFNLEGGRTNVMLAGSYMSANSLAVADRDFIQRGRARVLANNNFNYQVFNGFGILPPGGATPNIRSTTGANLVLDDGTPLNAPITFIPPGYRGAALDGTAQLVANAGKYNLDLADTAQINGGSRWPLLQIPTVQSLTATVRREFTSRIQAFVEATTSRNAAEFNYDGASFNNAIFNTPVPADAPNNPFQQAVYVAPVSDSADGVQTSTTSGRRVVAGLIFGLPGRWTGETDYTWSRSSFSYWSLPNSFTPGATAAVASGELDLLRDTSMFPVDFSPYLVEPGFTSLPFDTTLTDITLRMAGPLARLPGGDLQLSTMLEHRKEKLSDGTQYFSSTFIFLYPSRSQSTDSLYMELRAPLVSARNARPGLQGLELQLSGRRDEYITHGVTGSLNIAPDPNIVVARSRNEVSSTDPTVALRYQPIEDIALRASLGTGFLPPTVNQILPNAQSTSSGGTDPARGNTAVGSFSRINGGNPNLQPEESRSLSFGLIFTPQLLPGLRLITDYVKIKKEHNIANAPSVATLVTYFPERITRGAKLPTDPPDWEGPITFVDQTLINMARAEIEAYDVQLDYRLNTTSRGAFEVYALATWQPHYRQQFLPNAAYVDNAGVGSGNPLKFKANAGLTWSYGPLTLGWSTRYFDAYWVNSAHTVDINQGEAFIPAQTYHDAFGSYRIKTASGGRWSSIFDGGEITLGLRNVFDKEPPFDASNGRAYYSFFGEPRLASYYATLKLSF